MEERGAWESEGRLKTDRNEESDKKSKKNLGVLLGSNIEDVVEEESVTSSNIEERDESAIKRKKSKKNDTNKNLINRNSESGIEPKNRKI